MFSGLGLGLGLSISKGRSRPATITYPVDDHFMASGATLPMTGSVTQNNAIKVSNKLWLAWEGNNAEQRLEYVRVLNTSTGIYGPAYLATGNNPLVDDDHGNPAGWAIDSEGYYYFCYGAHDSDIYITRTTNPGDETSWTTLSPIAGSCSYPVPIAHGDDLFIFVRGGSAGTNDGLFFTKATSVTGGAPSWSALTRICTITAAGRNYHSTVLVVGADAYIMMADANGPDDYRRSVYYLVMNLTTGAVRNLANTKSYASGALPWSTSDMATYALVVDQGTRFGMLPCHSLSADNTLIHLLYTDCATQDGVYEYLYRKITLSTGAVSSPTSMGFGGATLAIDGPAQYVGHNVHKFDGSCIVELGDGSVDAYWTTDHPNGNGHLFESGGDVVKRNITSGGSLGAMTLVRAATTTRPLNGLGAILGGDSTTRVTFGEQILWADASTGFGGGSAEDGFLQGFIYGDSGVYRPTTAGTFQWQDLITAGFSIDVYDVADGRCVAFTDTEQRLFNLFNPQKYFAQPTAANKPVYSATSWDGTLASLTGDGTNDQMTQGSISVFGTEQHIFIVAERSAHQAATGTHRLVSTALSSGGSIAIIYATGTTADPAETKVSITGQGTGAVAIDTTGFTYQTKSVVYAKVSAADCRVRCNGATEVTGGALGNTTATANVIFADTSKANAFGGDIMKVVIVRGALRASGDTWRDRIEGKLAWDAGIQGNLDAGHAYKLARP